MSKFIVVEGLDGSGKSTQMKLLREFLNTRDTAFNYLHFPRTDSPVFGDLISRFLRGEMGDNQTVDPYLIALIYAGDREAASKQIVQWLDEDYLVIVDRYVYSNIAFQCAKLDERDEQKKLSGWIKMLEYEHYKIPKPDLNIFLDVPFSFTKKNLEKERKGEDRTYLNGKEDIHEKDIEFQERVRQIYLEESKDNDDLLIISCSDENREMYKPGRIFEKIIQTMSSCRIL